MRTTHFLIPGDQLKASATNFKIKKVPLTTIIRWFGIRNPLATNKRQSIGSKSIVTHALRLSKVASLATSLLTISN